MFYFVHIGLRKRESKKESPHEFKILNEWFELNPWKLWKNWPIIDFFISPQYKTQLTRLLPFKFWYLILHETFV